MHECDKLRVVVQIGPQKQQFKRQIITNQLHKTLLSLTRACDDGHLSELPHEGLGVLPPTQFELVLGDVVSLEMDRI